MKVYKLFKTKNGKLYPLYIYANEEFRVNKWIKAKCGVATDDGRVKSKIGKLSFRPGIHSCEIPFADHIGKRQVDGSLAQASDTVWCECEIKDKDYTPLAKEIGNGVSVKSCLKEIPKGGFYYFQTNPNARVKWIISGEIKINRILSNEEVIKICKEHGIKAQKVAA